MQSEFEKELEEMLRVQLIRRGITNSKILEAIRKTPRHLFVSVELKHLAYQDHPLSIGWGQTISQPFIVALMLQLLNPKENDKILEIGTGSGWQAGILSFLCKEVYTIERIPELAGFARRNLDKLDIKNIQIVVGDGTQGLKEFAPYDGIIVSCAAPRIPQPLIEQLRLGGKIVIPVGAHYSQDLIVGEKISQGKIEKKIICGCIFVPMVGEYGFKE